MAKPQGRASSRRATDVYSALLKRVSSGSFAVGGYLPSERELMADFGVSRPTVRKALQRLERQGHLACHPGIGYEVVSTRQPEAARGSKLVGVIWAPGSRSGHTDPRLPMIEEALSARGYTMLLGFTGRELAAENKRIAAFMEQGIAGLIVLPAQLGGGASRLGELIAEGFPVMAVGEPSRWSVGKRLAASCSFVGLDNALGSRLALDRLHESGHRRIAFARCGANPAMTRREQGYREWMAEHGEDCDYERIVSCAASPGSLPADEIRALAADAGGGPTAYLCETVAEAVSVAEVLRQTGASVPEDVSLAAFFGGIGDEPPVGGRPLTGLDYSWEDFTREIVEGLIAQMGNPSLVRRTLIRPRFVPGETLAPPAQAGSLSRE